MTINIDKFATHLRRNAASVSQARCARYVRVALEAGGARTAGHPVNAKEWGPTLLRIGYRAVTAERPETFAAKKGDVAVIQPTERGNPAGHIQAFDGTAWISDFVQRDFWPGPTYRRERPSYVIYRP